MLSLEMSLSPRTRIDWHISVYDIGSWLDHEKNKNLLIINVSLFVKCIYVSFSLPWSQELLPSLKFLQINFLQHLSFSFCASVV